MRRLRIALQFLTCLPLPGGQTSARELGRSAVYFPVAGLLVGAAVLGAYWLLGRALPVPAARVLALTVQVLLTGALHLDGLADTVDGLAGGSSREETLRIMRDPHVGAVGVVAVVLILLIKAVALLLLPEAVCRGALVVAPVAGRGAMVGSLAFPYVRETGVGRAFADHRSPLDPLAAAGVVAVAAGAVLGGPGVGAVLGGLAVGAAVMAVVFRRIGGVTGDVCGAVSEVVETGFLVALLAATHPSARLGGEGSW